MKKTKLIILIIVILVLTGCSFKSTQNGSINNQYNGVFVYFAKGDNWAATYTLIDVEESLFDSLYIQYIGERFKEPKEIEYELEGNGIKLNSTSPQKLKSVQSFQVSGETNKNLINITNLKKDTYKLTIIEEDGTIVELDLKFIGGKGVY